MQPGQSSFKVVNIPGGYGFLSVVNTSTVNIEGYEGRVDERDDRSMFVRVPMSTALTVPIGQRREFTFYFNNLSLSSQKAEIIFSSENLNINSALGAEVKGSVSIEADNVGLARQSQFPDDLSSDGEVKVTSDSPIPPGTNEIGKVEVTAMPTVEVTSVGRITDSPRAGQINLTANSAIPLRVESSNLPGRIALSVYNLDPDHSLFIGGSSVTPTSGFPIPAGGGMNFDFSPDIDSNIYAVSAENVRIAIMEVK